MKLLSLLAQTPDPFGTINSPVSSIPTDPNEAFSTILSLFLKIFMFIAILVMALYMLWGAYDWITSGGEKEKVSKAQAKITQAVIGIFILIIVFSLFCVITVNILQISEACLEFKIPQIGQ